jgi:hypothetical protein
MVNSIHQPQAKGKKKAMVAGTKAETVIYY